MQDFILNIQLLQLNQLKKRKKAKINLLKNNFWSNKGVLSTWMSKVDLKLIVLEI